MSIRERIEQYLAVGEWAKARAACEQLWQSRSAGPQAQFLCGAYEKLVGKVPLTECRVAILRSLTVEPVLPALRASAFASRLNVTVAVGQLGAYWQEALDDTSRLYASKPDVIILAIQTREMAPELWDGFAALASGERETVIERVIAQFRNLMEAIRRRSPASLIVHGLEKPARAALGSLDAQRVDGQSSAIEDINRELVRLAGTLPGTYVLDYDALVARYGRETWHDAVKWSAVNLPMRSDYLATLADEWVRHLAPLMGRSAKVLVTDLDNTLWGGVIGEDGMEGIKLNQEYPGSGYRALQRGLLDLASRGVLLAVASKNNPEDAWRVIAEHPSMPIRAGDIAAARINWQDKAQSLREIADELNVGLDALVFLDDNPAERELIRSELSEVAVLEASENPIENLRLLRDCPLLQRLDLSEEDAKRTGMYREQRMRAAAKQEAGSLESYYRGLEQRVEIEPLSAANVERIAQLTQKTNQCNLTTKRYGAPALLELAARPDWQIFAVRVADRFGDNGITGVAIVRDTQGAREIDTLLLSCRVLGRTVESAVLSFLAADARDRGIAEMRGWFYPTAKNAPSRDVYAAHGFERIEADGDAALWALDLRAKAIACPDWITLAVHQRDYVSA